MTLSNLILIRGGGDLASGVAARLHRAGLRLLITELPEPLVVRRLVAFAEAVYSGKIRVEGITARRVNTLDEAGALIEKGEIPVLVDPDLASFASLSPLVLIDARLTKRPPEIGMEAADLVIGLGPGFIAGENCHAVIETMRGHTLGRVLWEGSPLADTGIPESVARRQGERVLRAPVDGKFIAYSRIGDKVVTGQKLAEVAGQEIFAPFAGVVRGMVSNGLDVTAGMKVGDLDPRNDPAFAQMISDKSLAIGGAVFEAILSRPEIREKLWE